MTRNEFESTLKEYKLSDKIWFYYNDQSLFEAKVNNIILEDLGIRLLTSNYIFWRYDYISDVSSTKPIDIYTSLELGSDPEFFYVDKEGEVIPSTQVVPKEGNLVKQDGFQGELNPYANTCRAIGGSNIYDALEEANDYAKRIDAKLSFNVGHIISDKVWKSSPILLRRFGCNPTINAHESKFKRVTGLRERFRAAGGHIHLGGLRQEEKNDANKLVTLMDIVAGNTCVLIDRDESNARRRTMYGRAGEYRIKSYGLEYRVLSNFWLRSYTLWSMATALLRNAVGLYRAKVTDDLISRFDMKKVRDAINNNDKELALENFKILCDYFKEKKIACSSGLDFRTVDKIYQWLATDNPMSYIGVNTVEDSLKQWHKKANIGGVDGFENFINRIKIK